MKARDWLLLLIALDGDREGLDPIRVQKGLFLLAEEGGLPVGERYYFVPYNYGPMSPRVYMDVELLVRQDLVERRTVNGQRWRRLRATAAGHARAVHVQEAAGAREREAIERLREIRGLITSLGFTRLLEAIYRRYPAYAERSVFRRP